MCSQQGEVKLTILPMAVEDKDTDTESNLTVKHILDFVEKRRPDDQLTSSINLIPKGLRDVSPSSYDPRVVSIGPLHRDNQNVQHFEELKAFYVHQLLTTDKTYIPPPPEETLKAFVCEVLPSIGKVRACYGETNTSRYSDVELTKMMVVDACFIIRFITVTFKEELENTSRGTAIAYDLLLLENQIPFFVLQQVFDCLIMINCDTSETISIADHIYNFVRGLDIFGIHSPSTEILPPPPYHHILGFMAKCYWPSNKNPTSFKLPNSPIHSTIELGRAGVTFKLNDDKRWPMAIHFKSSSSAWVYWSNHTATLRMPVLRIDNYTELVLRNLIAYEQFFGTSTYVTSYAMAMDMLVRCEEDIANLTESGVIVNHLGSNDKAANVLNSLCKELPLLSFHYYGEWQDMDEHYNRWPKDMAEFRHKYVISPWNMIALLAGIVLFALTIIQTIYTVKEK